MKVASASHVYQLYENFMNTCILQDNSLLTDDIGFFNIENIDDNIKRFISNYLEGGDSFEDKIKLQFEGATYESLLVFAHANWFWCMSPHDLKLEFKRSVPRKILGENIKTPIKDDVFPEEGFGSAGPFLRYNKYYEIAFIILIFKQLKLKVHEGTILNLQQINKWIEKICLCCRYDEIDQEYSIIESFKKLTSERRLAMYNVLLHLCNPEKYEPIISERHKELILNTFVGLLEDASDTILQSNRDEKISYIRKKISENKGRQDFSFYDDDLSKIWNFKLGESDYNEFQALQYKKAIILYGPPGTSKTYSANSLARTLIYQNYFKEHSNVREYFKENPDITSNRIHHLQLHPNYTYEDFILGFHIINSETKPVKGYFLDLCEKVYEDKYPNVIILDEINRIDLSRLFGELFSGIENREKEILLSVKGFSIKVPNNLYIIGTMNEIDFSLERIDFALRRRFVWFFYGFNKEILRAIIQQKQETLGTNIKEEEVEHYINNAQNVNEYIKSLDELGEQYQIGQTFFSEIVDIFDTYKKMEGRIRLRLFSKPGPITVLWEISIQPILKAFLGNCEKQTQNEIIKNMEARFFYFPK